MKKKLEQVRDLLTNKTCSCCPFKSDVVKAVKILNALLNSKQPKKCQCTHSKRSHKPGGCIYCSCEKYEV
jgi:hypothetical protein